MGRGLTVYALAIAGAFALSAAAKLGEAGAPAPQSVTVAELLNAGTRPEQDGPSRPLSLVATVVSRSSKHSVFGAAEGLSLTLEDEGGRQLVAYAGADARLVPLALGERYVFEGSLSGGLFSVAVVRPQPKLKKHPTVSAIVRDGWACYSLGERVVRVPAPGVPDGLRRLELIETGRQVVAQLPA